MKGLRILGLVLWLLISVPVCVVWWMIDKAASGISTGNWYNAVLGGLMIYFAGGLMLLLALFLFIGGAVWMTEG